MDERDQPRVAVLGAGGWGRNHVRTWQALGALGVVCDPDPERRAEVLAAYPGVEVVAHSDDVLGRADIAAVVIATPAGTHAELALAAIDAGHDVLVEKPLATNLHDAEKVVDAAAARGAVLAVGHVLEHHPAVAALDDIVRSGTLGELRWLASHRLNLGRVRTVEDVLWSFAPHDIAMLLRLAGGPPDTVTNRRGSYVTPGIADVAFCGLSFPHGVEGQVLCSWLHPFKEHRLVVVGTERMAVFDDVTEEAKLRLYRYSVDQHDDGPPTTAAYPPEAVEIPDARPLDDECRDFLGCVRDRLTPVADGRSGLEVLRVLEAADRSALAGGIPVALAVP